MASKMNGIMIYGTTQMKFEAYVMLSDINKMQRLNIVPFKLFGIFRIFRFIEIGNRVVVINGQIEVKR